jgi:glycosyltransferase involved in cell wall biosynthesis
MKLLSICVPTYNRNKELYALTETLLRPALDTYGDILDVIVCDNSDTDKANVNKNMLDPRILYRKNESNLGFAGNIIRCANEASSEYIWIISDNDPILFAGFEKMIAALKTAGSQGIDCLMLPYQTTDIDGNKIYQNRHVDLKLAQVTTLIDTLRTEYIPFVLISGAVVRLDKGGLSHVVSHFGSNLYLQAIMYLEMLAAKSTVQFLDCPVIDYFREYTGNVTVSGMANSMDELCRYLALRFDIENNRNNRNKRYRVWLTILIHHRGGFYKIREADSDRWAFLMDLYKYLSIKSLFLALLLALPKPLFCPSYVIYRSFYDLKAGFSWGLFFKRLKVNHSYIEELKSSKMLG